MLISALKPGNITEHQRCEIFNTDQGSQFTTPRFTQPLLGKGIKISMDGRGRALDNIFAERLWRAVKYEEVYLKQYGSLQDLLMGYFMFYNEERLHQSLDYKTPDVVYRTAAGGGAKIVDKFNHAYHPWHLVATSYSRFYPIRRFLSVDRK